MGLVRRRAEVSVKSSSADGDIHAFQESKDRERTKWLEEEGYRVLRFANATILQQTEAVLETILAVCDGEEPPP